jgi:hypothetical protein
MPYPDLDAVDELVHGAFASHGFTNRAPSGEESVDEEALKDAVYTKLLEDHTVSDASNLSEGAITAHELYEAILPKGPGARKQPVSDEESAARNTLLRKLWAYTNTGVTGHCQKRAEAEGHTLVLCEAQVGRTYHSEETGRPRPTTEPGRFFTDHPDLIAAHSTLPSSAKLAKAAEAVSKHMQMALRRHPELAPTVARQVGTALKQAQASLAPVADAKAAAALSAPRSEEVSA